MTALLPGRSERRPHPPGRRLLSAPTTIKLRQARDGEPDAPTGEFEAVVAVFDNVDWYGDRLRPGAFTNTLAEWAASGHQIPVLWSHQAGNPDAFLGWVVEARELPDRGLWVRAQIDQDLPKGPLVTKLMDKRLVKEFSFAFDEVRAGPALNADGTALLDDDGWPVWDLLEVKLFEVGPCFYPANPDTELLLLKDAAAHAVRRVKEGRVFSAANETQLLAYCEDLRGAVDGIESLVQSAAVPKGGRRPGGSKGAIQSHSTGTSDSAWDGPAQEANLSNDDGADVYRRAFAWQDPDGDPDAKGTYKFIHHFVGADGAVGAASTVGSSAAVGVLNGARGGANIPDDDRQGVYNHVARHLRDADLEPPELKALAELGATLAHSRRGAESERLAVEAELALVEL